MDELFEVRRRKNFFNEEKKTKTILELKSFCFIEFNLVTMDNNHYFGLYLIRIKHSLVLFSLFLAFQSFVYLFLAICLGKVRLTFDEILFDLFI